DRDWQHLDDGPSWFFIVSLRQKPSIQIVARSLRSRVTTNEYKFGRVRAKGLNSLRRDRSRRPAFAVAFSQVGTNILPPVFPRRYPIFDLRSSISHLRSSTQRSRAAVHSPITDLSAVAAAKADHHSHPTQRENAAFTLIELVV